MTFFVSFAYLLKKSITNKNLEKKLKKKKISQSCLHFLALFKERFLQNYLFDTGVKTFEAVFYERKKHTFRNEERSKNSM